MKSGVVTAIIIVTGFGLGWLVTVYGLAQPGWPLSVSGQPETVVAGVLKTNPTGYPTGLVVKNSSQTVYIDISRLPMGTATAHLNRQVTARGQTIQSISGTYLLISWLK